MDGEENEQMGVGEDWVCFDVEKEYVGEEDEVIWPHRPEERYGEKTDYMQGKMEGKRRRGRPATTWFQDLKDLDQAGHCGCITTGDRSGKMAKNHQSHSSADSTTWLERESQWMNLTHFGSCFKTGNHVTKTSSWEAETLWIISKHDPKWVKFIHFNVDINIRFNNTFSKITFVSTFLQWAVMADQRYRGVEKGASRW